MPIGVVRSPAGGLSWHEANPGGEMAAAIDLTGLFRTEQRERVGLAKELFRC
jgi:hypothetical protein